MDSDECRKVEFLEDKDSIEIFTKCKIEGFVKSEGDVIEIDLSMWLEPFDEIKMSINLVEFVVKFYKENCDIFEIEDFDEAKLTKNLTTQGYSYLKTAISFLNYL